MTTLVLLLLSFRVRLWVSERQKQQPIELSCASSFDDGPIAQLFKLRPNTMFGSIKATQSSRASS